MNTLLDKFEVIRCLGQGTLGIVYLCHHPELAGQQVAVKVLHEDISKDERCVARLRNHFSNACGIQHNNVIHHSEFLSIGGLAGLTMEYADGGDLADRIQIGPLPISEAIGIISEICAGLQAIHDAGFVHRNIKAENILLTKDGTIKIADFCCSLHIGHKPDESLGTSASIDYISPEFMMNGQIDERADIYALGCLAYELFSGKNPFRGHSVYETMTRRLQDDPAPPGTFNPSCSDEMGAIILKAMARDVDTRYQSATELAHDLLSASKSFSD